jgi:hypothetical protein
MSTDMPQQASPIIIKGGSKSGIIAKAIEIWASGDFQITQQFQSQPDEWIESASDFSVSYVESVVVGEMGTNQQYCQTSLMTHPLTYAFKDSNNNDIFTVQEVVADKGYTLQISVDSTNDYFQVDGSSPIPSEKWTNSTFNTTNTEVYAVEVKDANNVPVCRLLRANGEDIYLNLEPA